MSWRQRRQRCGAAPRLRRGAERLHLCLYVCLERQASLRLLRGAPIVPRGGKYSEDACPTGVQAAEWL